MFATLATILFVITLVLGGGGATIAAAQPSLPDQPLYGVKVWSEDVRAALAFTRQSEYQLALEFANRRGTEAQALLASGRIPPESVQQAWQNQIELALSLAAEQPDGAGQVALAGVQAQLQTQLQSMQQIRVNPATPEEAVQARLQVMLQERLRWAELGLEDPAQLREQLRQQSQNREGNAQPTGIPSSQPTDRPTGEPSGRPAEAGGGNPWTTGTPTPGSGYGPGPGNGDCPDCTPVGTAQGGSPWVEGTPTPGSGYGPGPGTGPGPEQTDPQEPAPGNGPAATQAPSERQQDRGGTGGGSQQEPGGQTGSPDKGGGKQP